MKLEKKKGKESAASHNKRVSNVPHTIFFLSVAARQKALLVCGWGGGRKKSIFHRRQKENKKISFLFLSPPYEAHFVLLLPNASASIISFDFTAKKRKRHQNEIFYVEDIL